MSESPAKVRLVRCPKCDNLLPEVTDYAVYQCGGCGAVLRATNKHIGSSISSEKSGDENDGVSNKIPKESVNLDFSRNSVQNMSLGSENGATYNGSSGRRHERDDDNNTEFEEPKPVIGNGKIGPRNSVRSSNRRYGETGLQEGSSSSYHYAPRHEYAELVQNSNDHLEVEDDRDELLRKLDELKDQIVRSRDKSKEKVPTHHPYANIHHNSHSLLPPSNQVQIFNDPFRPQNHVRTPIMPYEQQNPYHPYYSGQYVSQEMTDNRLFHHPSCSCLVCYNKHHQAPPPPPPPLPPIAPPVMQNDPNFYHHDYNNRRFSNLSLNSHGAESHTRWSNDLRRPPRGILATGGRRCHPIAGGSPFVACCKCYELLQVPEKSTKKMRCAACSEVMLISIVNKKLVLSVYVETNRDSEKPKDDLKTRGDAKWGGTEFSSEDYDNSGNYDFESMDKLQVGGPSLTSYKSAVSYTSEDEEKLGIREDENSVDAAMKAEKPSPPPSGSPLQDHFDYSTTYNRAGKGNRSQRMDIEPAKVAVDLGSHGSSMKDAAVASEIEISSNEYCINTGTSLESGDTNRETDHQRNSGGNVPFFMGMIKKSFRELSKSTEHVDHGKVHVTVNGHLIPDRLVKKAEKRAGPIQPGEYWYDARAGFWGMMGGPCRGIIPPFIEEFNYPMPEKCADGNTNVFVNGRELHQRDLDLLSSRGLPTDTDRSYVVEISGRVLDEDSGQELECLGKLAPTVERKKHGFGMKPPKAAAA
ncbi:uncharacterized protein LOC112523613 [Cynara cardunculus var. scolymus]|uniref:Uncharacterized protein n=1 Tax=Cynara cardunculus var. scolymus TaxID=59895 RepID=A0A103XUR9_CYNCS|nr:uncharacterized protein LOC112523613 [Cynara cardunculus var. scolymus]KVH97283.1 Protein of unknown function DUF3133 [Cynara cardunculus var. scolymus]